MSVHGKQLKSIVRLTTSLPEKQISLPEKQMVLRSAKKHVHIREKMNVVLKFSIDDVDDFEKNYMKELESILKENKKNWRKIKKGLKKEIEEIC